MTAAWRGGPGHRDVRPQLEGGLCAQFEGAERRWQNLQAGTERLQSMKNIKQTNKDKNRMDHLGLS